MDPLLDTFDVIPGETVVRDLNVPSGPARTITAVAYDSPSGGGQAVYAGQSEPMDLVQDVPATASITIQDNANFLIQAVDPAADATGVPTGTAATITFSHGMDPSTITDATFTLAGAGGPVAGLVVSDGGTATFTPTAPMALASLHTATLTNLKDSAGVTFPPVFWSFTTRDGGWAAAQLIETNTIGDALSPRVGKDSAGNAITAWKQLGFGGGPSISFNRYVASTGQWGAPQLIESDGASAVNPQIVVTPGGNAMAVWERTASTHSLYAGGYDVAADQWGLPTILGGGAVSPVFSAAGDGFGNVFVVWEWSSAISAVRYDAAAGQWGLSQSLLSVQNLSSSNPEAAVSSGGNAVAVWVQGTSSVSPTYSLHANRYDAAAGLWGGSERISGDSPFSILEPRTVMDPAGNIVVVWVEWDGVLYSLYAARYDVAADLWSVPLRIEDNNTGNVGGPRLAIDPRGNAIVVWEQWDGAGRSIWANRYDTITGQWGTAQLIEFNTRRGAASYPQIAMDPNGNALAVWTQFEAIWYNIYANRYDDASGLWGTPQLIETNDAIDTNLVPAVPQPQLAIDPSGRAVAVWSQWDGAQYSVYANRFE
jgi:hypothetical protein